MKLPYDLLVAYVVIGWLLLLALAVTALVFYLTGMGVVDHTLFAFSGEVPLWMPASEFAGLAPRAGPVPTSYDEDVARYLGDSMTRYMEWYASNTVTYLPRPGSLLLMPIYTEQGDEMSCILVDVPAADALMILFKGTTSAYEWSIDFTYQTTSTSSVISGAATASRSREQRSPLWTDADDVLIHQGFAQFYSKMRSRIHDGIARAGRSALYLCGHSLGAGVANVCLFDVLQSQLRAIPFVYCVTVASPRVGNPAFARYLDQANLYQLRNTADIVPLVPLTWTPSLKGEKELFEYEHAGTAMLFENRSTNLKGAHMLWAYQQFMLRAMLTPYREGS